MYQKETKRRAERKNRSVRNWIIAGAAIILLLGVARLSLFSDRAQPVVVSPVPTDMKDMTDEPMPVYPDRSASLPQEKKIRALPPVDEKPEGMAYESEVLKHVSEFESRALHETDTAYILVETFGARLDKPFVPLEDGEDGLLSVDVPGAIAFSPLPDSVDRMAATMEAIAQRYFETFPRSPRVTISIIRGGGVRGSRTFLNTADGIIPAGKRFRNKT
jgi:hypothetical protein